MLINAHYTIKSHISPRTNHHIYIITTYTIFTYIYFYVLIKKLSYDLPNNITLLQTTLIHNNGNNTSLTHIVAIYTFIRSYTHAFINSYFLSFLLSINQSINQSFVHSIS